MDSSTTFLTPVLLISLIKNVEGRILNLQMFLSWEGLQRLWRMKIILTTWRNGLKRRGCNSVWSTRWYSEGWDVGCKMAGWIAKQSFFSEGAGGQSEHKMNMSQEGQAVAKNPNIVGSCINNVGICKKHEIVLLLSHHSWSTGSSLGHCVSRKMRISWKECKERSKSDWGSGKHDLWGKTEGSDVV